MNSTVDLMSTTEAPDDDDNQEAGQCALHAIHVSLNDWIEFLFEKRYYLNSAHDLFIYTWTHFGDSAILYTRHICFCASLMPIALVLSV